MQCMWVHVCVLKLFIIEIDPKTMHRIMVILSKRDNWIRKKGPLVLIETHLMEMFCECLVEKRKAAKIMNTFSLWFKSHKRSDKWNALFFSHLWKEGRFHTCDWRHRLSPNDQISYFLSVVLFPCRTLPFLTFFLCCSLSLAIVLCLHRIWQK